MPGDPTPCEYRYPDLATNPPTAYWAPTFPPSRRGSDRSVDFGVLTHVMPDGVTQFDYGIGQQADLWVLYFDVLTDRDVDAFVAFFAAVGSAAIYVKSPSMGGVFRKVKPVGGSDGRAITFRRGGPDLWSGVQKFRTVL